MFTKNPGFQNAARLTPNFSAKLNMNIYIQRAMQISPFVALIFPFPRRCDVRQSRHQSTTSITAPARKPDMPFRFRWTITTLMPELPPPHVRHATSRVIAGEQTRSLITRDGCLADTIALHFSPFVAELDEFDCPWRIQSRLIIMPPRATANGENNAKIFDIIGEHTRWQLFLIVMRLFYA